jgi:hypothetical protein
MLTATVDQVAETNKQMRIVRESLKSILDDDQVTGQEEKDALLNSLPSEPHVFLLWSTS